MKSVLHVHSTYSDGEFTLPELKEIFQEDGCSIVGITDHADSFDPAKLSNYIQECQSLSDDRFSFFCGLEYTCDQNMHILGYGSTALAKVTDPQQIIRHIEEHGGISVIAHPKDSMFPWIESFSTLPFGIETWNSKYDGQYAPRPRTFELLQRLRARRPEMRAFYGQDLHWHHQFRGLFNNIQCASLHRSDVMNALRSGNYFGLKADLELPSSGVLPTELSDRFAARHAKSSTMRRFIGAGKKLIDTLGIPTPASLKAQLRRIF